MPIFMAKAFVATILLACPLPEASAAPRPHIVFAMVDDWGWNDVGYHRTANGVASREIATPHIDALVAQGVELDQHYAYQ
eukprot:gene1732-2899_t